MIGKILLSITACAAFSDGKLSESACEEFEKILNKPNQCQTSCRLTSIISSSSMCDGCEIKDVCYPITCICEEPSCMTVKPKGQKANDCKNCLTAVCDALTSTRQPTTGSPVAEGTQSTKSVYSNSTTISFLNYSHPRNDTQDIASTHAIPQSNESMNGTNGSTALAVGVAVGVVVAVALILIAAFLIFRHVRRRKRASAQGVTDMTDVGYQHMTIAAPKTPVAPYDNLMTTPPGEQNPQPAKHMGSGSNEDTGYDNAGGGGGRIHSYEEIKTSDSIEKTTHSDDANVVTGTASGRVTLFGESGETTLLDNEFYGDNAPIVQRSKKCNANDGETTVVDNDFYE